MLREILARFGVQFDGASLQAAGTSIGGVKGQLIQLAAVVGAGAIVNGIRSFVHEMVRLGDEVAQTSAVLGISGHDLQAWRFAAERAGIPADALTGGLQRLQRNVVAASDGVTTAVDAFGALGVSAKDSDGNVREVLDILPDLADGFAGLETQAEKSARAQQIFGRAGAQLVPLFENGAEGVSELLARFEELGGGFSEEFLENASAANNAMNDFDVASEGLRSTIAVALLPAFTRLTVGLVEIVAAVREATEGTHVWEIGIVALTAIVVASGLAMFSAYLPMIALFVLLAAGVAAIVLLVDDFITFLEGGDSVIGEFFDEVGIGSENAREFFQRFGSEVAKFFEAIPGFAAFFVEVWGDAFSAIGQFFSEVVDQIVDFWTREFPALVGDAVDSVTDFFGLDRAGSTASEGAAAARTSAPVVTARAPVGGGTTTVNQQVRVEVGNGDPVDVERAVRRAMDRANGENLRAAKRALTPVVG